jgi:hypothetical protein
MAPGLTSSEEIAIERPMVKRKVDVRNGNNLRRAKGNSLRELAYVKRSESDAVKSRMDSNPSLLTCCWSLIKRKKLQRMLLGLAALLSELGVVQK